MSLPIGRNVQLVDIMTGKTTGIADDTHTEAGHDVRTAGPDLKIGCDHDIVAEHFTAVTAHPVFILVAHAAHDLDNTAHVEVVISLLAAGSHDRAGALGQAPAVPRTV